MNIREFSSMPHTLGWLVVMVLLALQPDGVQAQTTGVNSAKSVSLSSLAPRQRHKLRVSDKEVAAQVENSGGELVADYGSFKIFEVDDAVAQAMKNRGGTQSEDEQSRIELNAGEVDTSRPERQSQRHLVGGFSGKHLHLVQFAGPVLPEWRDELEQSGVRIVAYIPHNSYLVYGDAGSVGRMQAVARAARHVQWDGEFSDEYKIHPEARAGQKEDSETPATDLFAIQLVDDPEVNAATLQLINQLKLAPIRRQFTNLDYLNVIVHLPPDRLADIAARPEVISIQPYYEPHKMDERQDQIIAGNLTGNSPSGPGYLAWLADKGFSQAQFAASGFVVDVSDSGLDNGTIAPGHFGLYQFGDTSLGSRVVYSRLEGTPNVGSTLQGCDGHGTLNSHIIAGYNDQVSGFPHTDSAGFHYGLGVCPFVSIGSSVIFDPETFTSPDYDDLQSRAYHDGARISANSWGGDNLGAYNVESQNYDRLVRDAQPFGSAFPSFGNQQMVIVFAAGNAGPSAQTIDTPGSAKNVITVGAAENVRSLTTPNGGNNFSGNDGCNTSDFAANNVNDMASFSSRGPCSDGRKKPDLVAPGTHVTGGVAQNFPPPFPTGSGSAISCFDAAGVCALPGAGTAGSANNFFPLGQQFYTVSSGTSHATPAVAGACALLRQYFINDGLNTPSPALTKAYLMNSARYMSGSGANDSLWSNNQGMGELNLGAAFDGVPRVLLDQRSQDKFTASGQTRTFTGTITDPGQPFRITLAWTDAPGNTAGDAFNNDLDLTVTVGGVTYKGNIFNGATSIPGGAYDFQNNVESVFLPAGASGSIVVTVTAANINSDGVPNQFPFTDQDFALVIYNAVETFVPVLAVDSTLVTAESCGETNGAVDPNETVTVDFALKNLGAADTTNLVVTLLSTNGITAFSGPQSYGTLVAGGSSVARPFSFIASGMCGDNVTARLQLQDGTNNLGVIRQEFTLGKPELFTNSRTNSTSIAIPASGTSGSGSPFPSTVSLSGITDPILNVTVTLDGLSHTYPDDLDILLVGPTGQSVLLMSDCGGGSDMNGVTLTFDDNAPSSLPNSGQIPSGEYKPTNYGGNDSFSPPAPAGPYGTSLAAFNSLNPNGTWSLYVQDDAGQDVGNLAQGWSLSITTSNFSCCYTPAADLSLEKTVSTNLVGVGSNVTFTLKVTNHGPDTVPDATVTDTLPAELDFVSAVASQGSCTNIGGVVTCQTGPVANGASASFDLVVTATVAGSWTNTAGIEAQDADLVTSNDTASVALIANTPPVISDIQDKQTGQNVPVTGIAFTIGDAETTAGSLVLSVSSTDTNVVPDENLVFGGSNSNHTLTITPATDAVGITTITITVSDGISESTDSFKLTIFPQNPNEPPVLNPITNRTIFEGTLLTFTNSAADNEAPPQLLTFSLVNPPPGANVDPASGVFSWIPSESQGPGNNLFSVVVTDNGFPMLGATQKFTVIVLETNSAPNLPAISNYTVLEGDILTITNIATDADEPPNTLTFGLVAGFPVGAAINTTNGLFTWTPDELQGPGTNSIGVFVTDNGSPNLSATQAFTVIVLESNSPPQLLQLEDRTITEGETLVVTNVATDADIPTNTLTFSLGTNAPTDADFNSTNGVIKWTPTEIEGPSTNYFPVVVTDNGSPSLSSTQVLTVVVLEANSPPTLSSINAQTVLEGQTLTVANSAGDTDIPANILTFSLQTNAPPGANINPVNGLFTWIPSEDQGPSTNVISVIVSDNGSPSMSTTQSFTAYVLESNSPPVLTAISNRSVYAGTTLAFTNSVTDTDIPPNAISFSLDPGAPPGASVGVTNGVFTWTPNVADIGTPHSITLHVTDDGLPPLSDEQTFQVNVLAGPVIQSIALSNNTVTITWSAIADLAYRLQYKTNVTETNWSDISPDVTATGLTASKTDSLSKQNGRYYRVMLVQ